jgi:transglutaminase-like putative cysteine protease
MVEIKRRTFLLAGLAAAATPLLASETKAASDTAQAPSAEWRKFRTTTNLELPTQEAARSWIPLPQDISSSWLNGLETSWTSNADQSRMLRGGPGKASMLELSWKGGKTPVARIESTFGLRDRSVDPLSSVHPATMKLSPVERMLYTSGTSAVPIDGAVRALAAKIIDPHSSDVQKVHDIYAWMVLNTYRDPATRGCGEGNVAAMLRSGDFGGKCADLNALFVGLVRSAGIPARELYGIRVGASRLGYHSLGANSADITKAQHCRAEVFLDRHGWTPVDPADVRKVMLEEAPGGLPLTNVKVEAARSWLFGSWEGNWLPYNDAQDIVLDGSNARTINFIMYPQAVIDGHYLDCLEAKAFRYEIKSEELST